MHPRAHFHRVLLCSFVMVTCAAAVAACGSDAVASSSDAGASAPLDAAADAATADAGRSADAAAVLPDGGLAPFPTHGAPIHAPDGEWTWVEFPDSFCRDGSHAGVSVNLNSKSNDVMLFLEGGGACFDELSCSANPASARKTPPKIAGVFDRENRMNPVRHWNYVFVPYCTGDVHAGTNPNGNVEGVDGTQKFVGRNNMEAFLQRIVPTFPDAESVLLTGESAGGFGAAASALVVQRAFSPLKVHLVDDSGPPMSGAYLAPCLQQKWRDTWGLDRSMLADCGRACPNRDDFVFDFAHHMARVYADRSSGLLETTQDEIISGFFGAGLDDCHGIPLITPLPPEQFEQGLLEFRESLRDRPNFGTYYLPGTTHTWIGLNRFYTANVNGTSLRDWFANIVDGTTQNVGP